MRHRELAHAVGAVARDRARWSGKIAGIDVRLPVWSRLAWTMAMIAAWPLIRLYRLQIATFLAHHDRYWILTLKWASIFTGPTAPGSAAAPDVALAEFPTAIRIDPVFTKDDKARI